jgi:penicillin-binding protein 1A
VVIFDIRQEAKLLMSDSAIKNPRSGKKPARKAKKQSRARRVAGTFGRALMTVFLIFVITCTLVGGALAFYVINFVTPQDINLDSANLDTTTIIYANDAKTNKPVEVAQVSGAENRTWYSISQMPENLQNAFVCTEDQRFYEHDGVDWKRTVSSFANLFFHFYGSAQGGSTITQQLVNNLTQAGKGVNYGRKIQEIVNALALEKKYPDKQQILEAYLNTINLNEGCYGVETASENYFGKDVNNLDLAECAALACLPKAPSTYDPRNHPAANAERRQVVLKNMLNQKKITQAQYNSAINEKLKIAPKESVNTRGWFEDMVIADVQNDLVKKYGWTPDHALTTIYTKGLKIYTTMNPDVQSAMDKVYADSTNTNYWYQYAGTVQPQSSMMVVNYSGQIMGVEGGRGQKTGNMVYNRATDPRAIRPPGSSLKPLGVYGPAIDLDKITWSSLISTAQIMVPGNPNPWPANDDGGPYTGSMTVVSALAESINTIAVNIDQDDLSPLYTFNFLTQKLGFTTLNSKRDINPGIAIGAIGGVTAEEMAGGYEIFGNNGLYTKPYDYTQVDDNEGNVLLQNKPIATKAIGADTAFVMNQLLQQDVLRPDGTGVRAKIPGVVVGGKTGTTNDHKDRWFCGITPDYVGVVWFGYDTPKDIPGYNTLTNPALKAWQAVMAIADKNPIKSNFPTNGNVVPELFDPTTGYITAKGTETGWFKVDDLPTAPVPAAAS